MVSLSAKLTALRAAKQEQRFGDFALLKADLLGVKAAPAIAACLEPLTGYYPPIDLQALEHYPENSFGRVYADHMFHNQLTPFTISPSLDEVARRNVFALRYAVTHDMFHVLLGFDTSYAGEIGVLAFAAAQGYSSAQRVSLAIARGLYPLLAPSQIPQIRTNTQRGLALGKQVHCLLAVKFEEHWQVPLPSLREQLGLPPQPPIIPKT